MPLPKISKATIKSFETVLNQEIAQNTLQDFIEERWNEFWDENGELFDFIVEKTPHIDSPMVTLIIVYWLMKNQEDADKLDKEYANS